MNNFALTFTFSTYSFAEFKPGPNLNLVIGPNGTGKSTLVAAIILGLGGNPKTVGRGSKAFLNTFSCNNNHD